MNLPDKNFSKKCLMAFLLCCAAVFSLSGCRQADSSVVSAIKTSPAAEENITIHFYGNLDNPFLPFLDGISRQFPEITLEYEFQWDDAGRRETERRMLHGDGPDLCVADRTALLSMADKGLLLDLSESDFSTRYHVSAMTSLDANGKVYGLPMPNDFYCLICNRGILRAHGIEAPPATLPELIEDCRKLAQDGQGSIIVDSGLYYMLLHTSYLCTPRGYEWLTAYNQGEAAMDGTPAADAWTTLQSIAEYSGCSGADASALPIRRTELMLNGTYAFRATTLSNLMYMKTADPTLDLIALPSLGNTEEGCWLYYSEIPSMRYFAANAKLDNPDNAAKKKAVLQILDWISTEDGQRLLASCSASTISHVSGVKLAEADEMEYLEPVIAAGHLTYSQALERGVRDVVSDYTVRIAAGNATAMEAIRACDRRNAWYISPSLPSQIDNVIGSSKDHIYWRKPAAVTVGSPMAQLAAVAMAESFPKADFAFAMAKNTASSIYPGDITLGDIAACATGEQDSELLLVEATGQQIKEILEAGIGSPAKPTLLCPYGISGAGRLLHPAGLTYRADVGREKGDKIIALSTDDGKPLDMERTYTIAVSRLMVDVVSEPNLKNCVINYTGKHLTNVLTDYVKAHGEISSPPLRFEIIGAQPIYELP